jgi:hypothetical protein
MAQTLKSLAPDGAYGQSINGYGDMAQKYKEQFLRDARALLKQAGQILTQFGWTECDIRVNPSGVAGSGDVHADFWNPNDPLNIVYCTIGSSGVSFARRKDGVIVMARKEKREVHNNGRRSSSKVSYRNTWMGMNQWIDPGMNGQELGDQVLKIAGLPEADRTGKHAGCAYHSRTAGSLSVPPAIIRNSAEAEVLKEALGTVIAAARADASVRNGEQPLAEAKTGLHQMTLLEAFENA